MILQVSDALWNQARIQNPDNLLFQHDLQVYLLDDQINAFALPGNIVVFGTGLLAEFSSFDQLAAVTAHELIHIIDNLD